MSAMTHTRREPTSLVAIVEVLEADGGWMDKSLISDEVCRLWPGIKAETVHRALFRLEDRGAVEKRIKQQRGSRVGYSGKPEPRQAEYRTTSEPWDHVNEHENRGRRVSA